MSKELLIVNKKVLPKCFEKVVEAKKLLQDNKYDNISKVCEHLGISRSTYYKYQDYVFDYNLKNDVKEVVISFTLIHEKGSLSKVCDQLSKLDISILTVFQSSPIDTKAPVMLSLDITNMKISIKEFEKILSKLPNLSDLKIMSFK